MDEDSYNLQNWFDFPVMTVFVILFYPHYLTYRTYLFQGEIFCVWNYEQQSW